MLFTGSAFAGTDGTVRTMRFADPEFESTLNAPSAATEAWLRSHFWRMIAWSPYFDSKTGWYPNAWLYQDAYAVYRASSLVSEHPEWVFRDAAGNKLYIPFECAAGTCPEYAGNIANAEFRKWWIEKAKSALSKGYKGLYIDDVNMEFRVSNGQGNQVAPIDPATRQPMSYEAWRRYMAQFMEQIRAALPGTELIHNAIWFSDPPDGIADPFIQREINASSGVFLERGINDRALTGGAGLWSLSSFLAYAEAINARGRPVILGNASSNAQGEAYDLAGYFLISDGQDAIDVGQAGPQRWWPGWELQLGEAKGARYLWDGLLRRDFSAGMVLLNPPEAPTQTVTLTEPMLNPEGKSVTSVTLPPSSGAILRPVPPAPVKHSPTPTPTPTPAPVAGRAGATSRPLEYSSPWAAAGSPFSTVPLIASEQTKTVIVRAARHGRRATLVAGRVLRATKGAVSIVLQTRHGRTWKTIKRLLSPLGETGGFEYALALSLPARYRVRAIYSGAPGFAPSSSRFTLVSSHAVPH